MAGDTVVSVGKKWKSEVPQAAVAAAAPTPADPLQKTELADPLHSVGPSAAASDAAQPAAPVTGEKRTSAAKLHAKKTALQGKKLAARGLDTALFAPLHAIDQLSVIDLHAKDAVDFALSGKTRRQRDNQNIKHPTGSDSRLMEIGDHPFSKTEKGRKSMRTTGRTALRDSASTGRFILGDISRLKSGKDRWGFGESVLGFNPAKELRRTGVSAEVMPHQRDNVKITAIKEELAARKLEKKNAHSVKRGLSPLEAPQDFTGDLPGYAPADV